MSKLNIIAQLFDSGDIGVPQPEASGSQIQTALQVIFQIAGVVAVIVIVVAGISYIVSAGDPQKTAKAKDAILYACIGLVVAILANIIVFFVMGRVLK